MNHFFASNVENDKLMQAASTLYGIKTGELINIAIRDEFLPVTEPFRTEAAYLLQRSVEGNLDEETIRQSMSRGIRALAAKPISDKTLLQVYFSRYRFGKGHPSGTITATGVALQEFADIRAWLGMPPLAEDDTAYNSMVDDILDNWQLLWQDRTAYQVLATIAYQHRPCQPYTWFEGIIFLCRLEHTALQHW